MLDLDASISALVYSVLEELCPRACHFEYFHHNRVVRFVKEQVKRMPDFARFGIIAMTLCLDASAIFLAGKPFHNLGHRLRLRVISFWKLAPCSVFTDTILFYELFSIFGFYAEKEQTIRKNITVKTTGDERVHFFDAVFSHR